MGYGLKIGILGGTFDPIHMGHIAIAEAARRKYCLDKVVFIPSGNPPHKSVKGLASAKHRYEMVKLAVADNPYFEVNPIEVLKEEVSYTIDTLNEIKRLYPEDCIFFFIIGEDTLLEVSGWKQPAELLMMCTLIVYRRSDCRSEQVLKEADRLKNVLGASVCFVEGSLYNVSSTAIRGKIRQKISLQNLIPSEVEEYINSYSLYGGDE